MTADIKIAKVAPDATAGDFRACARIHKEAISEGFLATLDPAVLERIYRTAADSSNAFLFAAKQDGQIIGFICGSVHTGRFFRDCISRHFPALAWHTLPKLLSWRTIRRIAETLLYPARKKNNAALPDSEILNFCLTASARGKGVGGHLFLALVEEFHRRNVSVIRIVTGENQKDAISFYEARDARLVESIELHKGVKSRVYAFDIA